MKKYRKKKAKQKFSPKLNLTAEQLESSRQFLDAYQNMTSSSPKPSATQAVWNYIEARRVHYKNMGYPDPPLHPLEVQRRNFEIKLERERKQEQARRLEEQKQKRVYKRRAKKRTRTYTRKARPEQRQGEIREVRRVYRRKR